MAKNETSTAFSVRKKSQAKLLKSNRSAILWGLQWEFYRLEKSVDQVWERMRTVRSAFGKETVGARVEGGGVGGRCKIEGRWVMWINLAAARSIQRQFHGTWKWIRRVGFTLLKNVCVVFCVVRCHLCDALQNRGYSWFSRTCGDYHPCHLRLILAAGQRSGGISHISPSLSGADARFLKKISRLNEISLDFRERCLTS